MSLDRPLSIAFLISTLFHTVIFLPLPHLKKSPIKKSSPSLKITYLAPKVISPPKTHSKDKPITIVKHKVNKKNMSTKLDVDSSFKPKDRSIVSAPKAASQDAKIEIPPELPKEKEALYLDYYQSIREKIRRFVVRNYPRYIACGEVCLYFVLLSNGKLKEINVVEERSSQNRLLKEVAKKSVLESSPFLVFPQGLTQPQLSFNVIISFELED